MQSVISFPNSFKSHHNVALRLSLLESQDVDLFTCADFFFFLANFSNFIISITYQESKITEKEILLFLPFTSQKNQNVL